MLSLASFSAYGKYQNQLPASVGRSVSCDTQGDFAKDLEVVNDFCSKVVPRALGEICKILDGKTSLNISDDGKSITTSCCFKDYKDALGRRDVIYSNSSLNLIAKDTISENKSDFKASDFKYYEFDLITSPCDEKTPRRIFIKGALSEEGNYDPKKLEEFSFETRSKRDGVLNGKVTYYGSPSNIKNLFSGFFTFTSSPKQIFTYDYNRDWSQNYNDTLCPGKVIMLRKSGKTIRIL